ncbi:MAG: recombination-associated protein RdgC [Gammaproteobacteria bacterium]|nr:recombination-associated protein RdgC [Gammaproteobacteria bacterium]MCW5583773.1 recombination-associated protein RdgC [Gammaproteobacteria bacterium]
MWFKQVRLFQLTDASRYTSITLVEKLDELTFQECLPSMSYSAGWVSPVDEEGAPLVQIMNGYMMICLQIEEKILPPIVIRQELVKRIKKIEDSENRKVGQKEKYTLQDEIRSTLLPRAFSKLTKVYAYVDTKNHWLILSTSNAKKTEQFLSAFKKTFGDQIDAFQIKKLSAKMTSWLKHQNYSSSFSIEKSCVLQDTNHENRVIRCKEQDLFASSIQSLIKDGCEIKQLALNWQDRIDFVLLDDLSLQSIHFKDEIIAQVKEMEAGTKQQQFNADFLIMTETLNGLFKDLLGSFVEQPIKIDKIDANNVISMVKKIGS